MAVTPLITTLIDTTPTKNMNVNGSSVNRTFSYSPGSDINGDNSAELLSLSILLESTGTDTFNKFGKLTALSNGLEIILTIGGVSSTICTLKDNTDLVLAFPNNNFGSSAQGTLGAATGFGASVDVFTGTLTFGPQTAILSGTDVISVIVRDDLSTLGTLSCAISALFQAA